MEHGSGSTIKVVKPPKITLGANGMEAYITIDAPTSGEAMPRYTPSDFMDYLSAQNIVEGINVNALERIARSPRYGAKELVAVGTPAQPGTPGRYEYLFSQEFSKKPRIREDGSADFFSIKIIELVSQDQLIAVYHPAVQGIPGKTVQGKTVEPKPVRDLPPLGGRGFTRSEDNLNYYSAMDGKIVTQGNRILISPVYEITEDADLSTGDIDFSGDVVIHGGANGGVSIKASGNVTIEGIVEVCTIEAGKDIFLLSGVKGKNQTEIRSKGNITAEFIEYAYLEAKGDIQADVIFKSRVNCYGKVTLVGHRAELIGGEVSAIQGITAGRIGNDFGTITQVGVGTDVTKLRQMKALEDKINALQANIDKIKRGVADFDRISEEQGISYRDDPRRLQLLRIKIRDEASLSEQRMLLNELKQATDKGAEATVQVLDAVYPGTKISVGNRRVDVSDIQKQVKFVRTETGVRMEKLEDVLT